MPNLIKTTVGLPNTCCACGQEPTEGYWFAEHNDAARSGGGLCAACAKPGPSKADKALAEKAAADKAEAERLEAEKAAAEAQAVADKAAADKVASDKVASDKTAKTA